VDFHGVPTYLVPRYNCFKRTELQIERDIFKGKAEVTVRELAEYFNSEGEIYKGAFVSNGDTIYYYDEVGNNNYYLGTTKELADTIKAYKNDFIELSERHCIINWRNDIVISRFKNERRHIDYESEKTY
jgi:hypothetical protein